MDLLLPAKKLKHRLWLLRLHYSPDYFRRLRARREPFRFDVTRYRVPGMDIVMPSVSTFQVNHLEFSAPEGTASPSPTSCPNQIFLFWTGPNELTPNRAQAVAQLRALNPSTDLHLVTAQNLPDYLIRGSRSMRVTRICPMSTGRTTCAPTSCTTTAARTWTSSGCAIRGSTPSPASMNRRPLG